MTTTTATMTLEFRWTTSRGRDTYGYNICTLYVDGRKVARCNGGGYDMKGTCFGSFIASHYADRLLALTAEDMPEHSHWEPQYIKSGPTKGTIKHVGHRQCGKRVDDGRYFYGLCFVDPNYDPSKAVIGKDCDDRTLGDGAEGKTVEQAETDGESFGLERYQAFYKATSKVPTDRHTVPSIDGGCGMSSVEQIAKAIGISLEYVPTRRKNDSLYQLHDELD